jgi:hypothetical protein
MNAPNVIEQPEGDARGSHQRLVEPRYWHEIDAKEQGNILNHSGMTVGDFLKRFRQPDWCNYPDALGGAMGCWNLLMPGAVRDIKACEGCEECEAKRLNGEVRHAGPDNSK